MDPVSSRKLKVLGIAGFAISMLPVLYKYAGISDELATLVLSIIGGLAGVYNLANVAQKFTPTARVQAKPGE